MRLFKKNKKGFTLVEMTAVVAIVSMMTAMSVPQFVRMKAGANETAAQANLASLNTLVSDYYFVNGTYPDTATAKTLFTSFVNTYYGKQSVVSNLDASGNYWLFQGYRYDYRQVNAAKWECIAVPDRPQLTGNRYFIIDDSGATQETTLLYAMTIYPFTPPPRRIR